MAPLNLARARPPLARALSSLSSSSTPSYPFFSSAPVLVTRPLPTTTSEVTAMSRLNPSMLHPPFASPSFVSTSLPSLPGSTPTPLGDHLLLSNKNPFDPSPTPTPSPSPNGNDPNQHPEAEVSDAEWEIRVARGMLHLRDTLPRLFEAGADELFPRDVFSASVVLKLPVPFPIRISGITGYRMAFGAGRSGLHGESWLCFWLGLGGGG